MMRPLVFIPSMLIAAIIGITMFFFPTLGEYFWELHATGRMNHPAGTAFALLPILAALYAAWVYWWTSSRDGRRLDYRLKVLFTTTGTLAGAVFTAAFISLRYYLLHNVEELHRGLTWALASPFIAGTLSFLILYRASTIGTHKEALNLRDPALIEQLRLPKGTPLRWLKPGISAILFALAITNFGWSLAMFHQHQLPLAPNPTMLMPLLALLLGGAFYASCRRAWRAPIQETSKALGLSILLSILVPAAFGIPLALFLGLKTGATAPLIALTSSLIFLLLMMLYARGYEIALAQRSQLPTSHPKGSIPR